MSFFKPNVDEFCGICGTGEYDLVPVVKEITADLETPVTAFLKLRGKDCNFLLESVEGGENIARYSFIGSKPEEVLSQNDVDPLIELESRLKGLRCFPLDGLPKSFLGGYVGYISYDCVKHYEPKVVIPDKDDIGLPDSILFHCKSLIIFDHVQHVLRAVTHVKIPSSMKKADFPFIYQQACQEIDVLLSKLKTPLADVLPKSITPAVDNVIDYDHAEKADYIDHVNFMKERICQGDIIQAVPSRRVERKTFVDAFQVYRQLRIINPSPYMFFFDFKDFQIVGASPELLVGVKDGKVTTHPIAGTRKRGINDEDDMKLAKELKNDPKEQAEHIMLVDLGRNDLGRVCIPGSVKVDSYMNVEYYSHVMHLVSRVSGDLDPKYSSFDAFRSVFPAGTVSGAPKVRAMQLISERERRKRGIYAGAVGHFSYNGTLDTCIAIRTMVFKDGKVFFQAGGGIVYDSKDIDEYQETFNKMRVLIHAVELAEKFSSSLNYSDINSQDLPAFKLQQISENIMNLPQKFGKFGGRYVPETIVAALDELEQIYLNSIKDPEFHAELRQLQRQYVGRPTPLYLAKRLTEKCGGANIWLKREDLCHTGAHKINNALGMALLAKRTGKKRVIAETGAGQHGVATATACALLNLECTVYMGEEDIHRQSLNVFRMKLLGAKVESVKTGSRTLKDAINEAMRDWVTNVRTTFYLLGSAVGPHPFPTIVRDFQRIIGDETREQILAARGKLPDVCIACVGGGSNSIGMFHPFIEDASVKLVGIEAAGFGVETGTHSATIVGGTPGVLHGSKTYLLQTKSGQITETHSISAGLDYPGVGPQHAWLHESGRAQYIPVSDDQALEGLKELSREEGIIPALETAHAVYWAIELAKQLPQGEDIVVCLSGRGDKDMARVAEELNFDLNSSTTI